MSHRIRVVIDGAAQAGGALTLPYNHSPPQPQPQQPQPLGAGAGGSGPVATSLPPNAHATLSLGVAPPAQLSTVSPPSIASSIASAASLSASSAVRIDIPDLPSSSSSPPPVSRINGRILLSLSKPLSSAAEVAVWLHGSLKVDVTPLVTWVDNDVSNMQPVNVNLVETRTVLWRPGLPLPPAGHAAAGLAAGGHHGGGSALSSGANSAATSAANSTNGSPSQSPQPTHRTIQPSSSFGSSTGSLLSSIVSADARSERAPSATIPAGEYELPFSLSLPSKLPSTTDMTYAKISYLVKARLSRTGITTSDLTAPTVPIILLRTRSRDSASATPSEHQFKTRFHSLRVVSPATAFIDDSTVKVGVEVATTDREAIGCMASVKVYVKERRSYSCGVPKKHLMYKEESVFGKGATYTMSEGEKGGGVLQLSDQERHAQLNFPLAATKVPTALPPPVKFSLAVPINGCFASVQHSELRVMHKLVVRINMNKKLWGGEPFFDVELPLSIYSASWNAAAAWSVPRSVSAPSVNLVEAVTAAVAAPKRSVEIPKRAFPVVPGDSTGSLQRVEVRHRRTASTSSPNPPSIQFHPAPTASTASTLASSATTSTSSTVTARPTPGPQPGRDRIIVHGKQAGVIESSSVPASASALSSSTHEDLGSSTSDLEGSELGTGRTSDSKRISYISSSVDSFSEHMSRSQSHGAIVEANAGASAASGPSSMTPRRRLASTGNIHDPGSTRPPPVALRATGSNATAAQDRQFESPIPIQKSRSETATYDTAAMGGDVGSPSFFSGERWDVPVPIPASNALAPGSISTSPTAPPPTVNAPTPAPPLAIQKQPIASRSSSLTTSAQPAPPSPSKATATEPLSKEKEKSLPPLQYAFLAVDPSTQVLLTKGSASTSMPDLYQGGGAPAPRAGAARAGYATAADTRARSGSASSDPWRTEVSDGLHEERARRVGRGPLFKIASIPLLRSFSNLINGKESSGAASGSVSRLPPDPARPSTDALTMPPRRSIDSARSAERWVRAHADIATLPRHSIDEPRGAGVLTPLPPRRSMDTQRPAPPDGSWWNGGLGRRDRVASESSVVGGTPTWGEAGPLYVAPIALMKKAAAERAAAAAAAASNPAPAPEKPLPVVAPLTPTTPTIPRALPLSSASPTAAQAKLAKPPAAPPLVPSSLPPFATASPLVMSALEDPDSDDENNWALVDGVYVLD